MNAPETLTALRALDDRYPTLNATEVVLRVVTQDLPVNGVEAFLQSAEGMEPEDSRRVRDELDRIVLRKVAALLRPAPTQPLTPPPGIPSAPPPTVSAPPPTLPRTGGEFHAPEDATEIALHRARITGFEAKPAADPEATADAIAKEFRLAFTDDHLWGRYRTLAVSALKGIRKPFDVRGVLTRPTKVGGLALAPEVAERMLRAFQEQGSAAPAPVPSPARPAPAPARSVVGGKTMPAMPTVPRRTAGQPVPVVPRVPAPPPNLPVPPPPAPRSATPVPNFVPPQTRTPAAQARQADTAGRRVVSDVRQPKRTVGPVDELGLLTVDDLRRLDRNPEVAAEKLWGKFQNLAHESFALYAEAIKAWRRSPLYQLYVAMGTESLTTNRAVDVIANARLNQNQPTLSPKEFATVADLSKRLRL